MNKTKIYMGLPSVGTVVDFQSYMLREIAERYKDSIELVYPKYCANRIFHDYARNEIVDEFLASDCDILWFLDSDVSPPNHILDLVVKHGDKWKIAGAPYPIFMHVPGETYRQIVFTSYIWRDNKLTAGPVPDSGVGFVDGLATGCLFLKRKLVESLEKPYFEFKFDKKSRKPIEGEDLGFCLKMREKGIKFFTDYSMVCKHQKNLCLLEMNNYAITYAKKAVETYDKQVQGQIQALVERMTPKAAPKQSSLILPKF